MILVSVIIPCFNVEDYIEDCLDSVYNQIYSNIEVIVVDNNSSDGTYEKLVELKNIKYPTLLLLKEDKAGAPAARNKGLSIAKGEWVQFLDADDLLLRDKINRQINLIKSNKEEYDFIAGAYIKRKLDKSEIVCNNIVSNVYVAPFINSCGITSSNLWNRESLLRVGKWDESFKSSQETELMLRIILNKGKYIVDLNPLTIIRERESGQISQRDPTAKWKQYIDLRLNYLDFMKRNLKEEYNNNSGILYDFLMVSIITLSHYDERLAIKYYQQYISKNWVTANFYGFNWVKYYFIKTFGLKIYLRLSYKRR